MKHIGRLWYSCSLIAETLPSLWNTGILCLRSVIGMSIRSENIVYWTHFQHEHWRMILAATDRGLCYIHTSGDSFDLLADRVSRSFPHHEWMQDDDNMRPYTIQLTEYLQGQRIGFDLPLDLKGTSFQYSVWKALLEIPHGQTVSYSHIADSSGNPRAVRAVGAAVGANPVLIVVPCHRVIGKNGSLTGYRGGMETKARLLKLEGVPDMQAGESGKRSL
jgi:methylated-DNA-[protein]-cysteine S-methyltransferase